MFTLVRLEEKYRAHLTEMMDEWTAAGEKIIPASVRKHDYHDFDGYLRTLDTHDEAKGQVPSVTYFCLDTERDIFVGAVNIRPSLNEKLLRCGGHIGDGVRPSERGKGIGTEMVALALEKCAEMGIDRALMTCDKSNIASARTIEKNGGVLENEIEDERHGPVRRYWIDLIPDTRMETPRLILRHWEDSDAADLYEYAKDPRVGPAAGWPVHTSAENSREIIRTVLRARETYAVIPKETGRPAGSVGIHFREHGDKAKEAELGCWIGVPFWGKGLIPEALSALLHRCFTELGCETVWYGYFDGNEKSHRVEQKLGFTPDHTSEENWRGETKIIHYSRLTKEDWQKRIR